MSTGGGAPPQESRGSTAVTTAANSTRVGKRRNDKGSYLLGKSGASGSNAEPEVYGRDVPVTPRTTASAPEHYRALGTKGREINTAPKNPGAEASGYKNHRERRLPLAKRNDPRAESFPSTTQAWRVGLGKVAIGLGPLATIAREYAIDATATLQQVEWQKRERRVGQE